MLNRAALIILLMKLKSNDLIALPSMLNRTALILLLMNIKRVAFLVLVVMWVSAHCVSSSW